MHLSLTHGWRISRIKKLDHLYILMSKISIHLSPVINLKNHLNLQDNPSKFFMVIYESLCKLENSSF